MGKIFINDCRLSYLEIPNKARSTINKIAKHLDDVKIIPTHFVVPNVITVNNDHINDGFSLEFLHKENLEFIVLNRWGNVIFESKDETYFPNENVMNQISGDVTLFYILKSDKKILKQDFIYVIKE
jgi:hypothetical protein